MASHPDEADFSFFKKEEMKTRSRRLNHPIYLLLYIDITRQSVILTSALLRQDRADSAGLLIY